MMKDGEDDDHNSDCKKIITTLSKRSGVQKDVIKKNNDKIHPIGKPDKEGNNCDSFKETIYNQHKNYIKTYTSNKRKNNFPIKINIKLQPSLTRQQLKLLRIA